MGLEGGSFEHFDSTPTVIPIVITADTIEDVASKLSGSAGPSGIDSEMLKRWLLGFGNHSGALRRKLADFTTWLATSNPPWAVYRALMACRLVALDKQPGVRPLGIGEIYCHLMAKSLLLTIFSEILLYL